MQHSCESRVTKVTVHARGAIVTRRVMVPAALPAGEVELLVPGITPLADAGSLRAVPAGGARAVVAVRSALVVPEMAVRPGVTVEELRAVEARLARLDAERARLEERRTALLALAIEARVSGASPARLAERGADALAAASVADALLAALDERLLGLEDERRDLARARTAASLADAQATSASRMGAAHPTLRAAVVLDGSGPLDALDVVYAVPAARWWPLYTLRIEEAGRRATLWIEALVAQRSGEDWRDVALSLSTADLLFDARLPELASLRFGRAQARRPRGYRAAPEGLEAMFEGFDRAEARERATSASLPGAVVPPPSVEPMPLSEPRDGASSALHAAYDEEEETDERATQRTCAIALDLSEEADLPVAKSAPQAAPRSRSLFGGRTRESARMVAPSCAALPAAEPLVSGPVEPDDAWLAFDALTLTDGARGGSRGRLVRAHEPVSADARRMAEAAVEALVPTGAVSDPRVSRGTFDHRYEAGGLVDLPSDGLTHRVTVGRAEATPRLRFRAVPCEVPEVYREAHLTNPFDAPLLAGPVDVYVDGSLLAVAALGRVDRGGPLHVGMGTEERLKVARNVRVEESTAGLLGGSRAIEHQIDFEIVSGLPTEAPLELVDRVPVTDADDVDVEPLASKPSAQPYTQSERGAPVRRGVRWDLVLPPGGSVRVELGYRITLPSRCEIVGGNRRD